MSSGALTSRLLSSGQGVLIDLIEQGKDSVGAEENYGSPIEYMFAVASWVFVRTSLPEGVFLAEFRLPDADARKGSAIVEAGHGRWVSIFPQVVIGDYRVDFVIYHPRGLSGLGGIVVELDGHDFHERTKEQAARDKGRDRELQEAGFKVLRFTGSEVWADVFQCASKAMGLARDISIDTMNARNLMARGEVELAKKHLAYWP